MNPSHTIVGLWASGNLLLALLVFAFDPAGYPEVLVHIVGTAFVALFGLAILLAARSDRAGAQDRQPRRATAAALAAVGVAIGLLGWAIAWWVAPLAFYPLALAALAVRGERPRPQVRPWPATSEQAEPAGPARYVHQGSSVGVTSAVPIEHPAHGPPPPGPEPSPRLRGAVLALTGARAVVELFRRRRK